MLIDDGVHVFAEGVAGWHLRGRKRGLCLQCQYLQWHMLDEYWVTEGNCVCECVCGVGDRKPVRQNYDPEWIADVMHRLADPRLWKHNFCLSQRVKIHLDSLKSEWFFFKWLKRILHMIFLDKFKKFILMWSDRWPINTEPCICHNLWVSLHCKTETCKWGKHRLCVPLCALFSISMSSLSFLNPYLLNRNTKSPLILVFLSVIPLCVTQLVLTFKFCHFSELCNVCEKMQTPSEQTFMIQQCDSFICFSVCSANREQL